MKTRKLLAMLVAVAMIVTMLPVVAFADDALEGSIAWDPGKTGGDDLVVTVDGDTITFKGEIEWYPADEVLGRAAGHRVGVEIKKPSDISGTATVTVTIGENQYEWNLAESFFWYPLVTSPGQEFTATVQWDANNTQTFTVKISENATLEDWPAVTGRIYADDDEYDVGDEVELTFKFSDRYGKVTENMEDSEYEFYVWAEREEDEFSVVDIPVGKDSDTSLVKVDAADAVVKYSSNYDGEVTFFLGRLKRPDGGSGVKPPASPDELTKLASVTVEFVEDTESYKLTAVAKEESVPADGITANEVTITLTNKWGFPIKGKEILFDTSSSRLILNKESAVTDSKGQVKVKATSERAGEYTLYAELESDSKVELNDGDGIPLEFRPSSAYDIEVKKGDGAVVALDEDYTFEFEVFDIFGRTIKGEVEPADYIAEITAPDYPDDARIEDVDFLEVSGAVSWNDNENLKVKVDGKYLDEEGEYALRVKLDSGKYATAYFEVREQGDIVDMTIEYDPDYVENKGESAKPKVKIIDADGVEANADLKDLEFSVSNTRLATINKEGILKAKDDVEGIVTVTVVNTKHNVVATTEVRIGDVGAAGIEFDVPENLLVGEEYTIGMTVVDEDGKEYMDEPDFSAVVLSKPAGAKFEVDVYDDELEVYSDTKGEVKLIVTAREDDESVSGTLTLNFVTEPAKPAAGKVVLTIGANFGLVDGEVTDLDAPAFIDEGRTFVPVRFLAEAVGAEADWEPKDAAVETVYLTWDDMQIVIGIGDEFLTVIRDGEEEVMTFDGAARIVDGRTYLPFRAIGEAIGLEVDYGPKDGPVEWVSFE